MGSDFCKTTLKTLCVRYGHEGEGAYARYSLLFDPAPIGSGLQVRMMIVLVNLRGAGRWYLRRIDVCVTLCQCLGTKDFFSRAGLHGRLSRTACATRPPGKELVLLQGYLAHKKPPLPLGPP